MRGYGGERVINALLSYRRNLGVRAIISTLPYAIKKQLEDDAYKHYMAACARICTENTARLSQGTYMKATLYDVLHGKQDKRTGEQVLADLIKGGGLVVKS